jgi:hypothetical protein
MAELNGRWTPEEDALFRRLVEIHTDPEIIAAKLNRSLHALKTRAYAIGLPRKWFKRKSSLQSQSSIFRAVPIDSSGGESPHDPFI